MNFESPLNRANGILAKPRYYVTVDVLQIIYYALFDSHMRYACQIWGQIQHDKTFDLIQHAQKKQVLKNFKFQTIYGTF